MRISAKLQSWIVLMIAAWCSVLFCTKAVCGADLGKILSDWRERQQRTKNVWYQLVGTETTPKGTRTGDVGGKKGDFFPPKDFTGEIKQKIILDFDKHRSFDEKRCYVLFADDKKFRPSFTLDVYDGQTARSFVPREKNTHSGYTPSPIQPDAYVSKAKPQDITHAFTLVELPVFLAHGFVRTTSKYAIMPVREHFPLNAGRFRVTGKGRLNSTDCTIVRGYVDNRPKYEYWVDASRGSLILRVKSIGREYITADTTIGYENNEWGWVLRSWQSDYFRGVKGNTYMWLSFSIEAKEARINVPLEESLFQPQFTPGMVVKNNSEGGKYYHVNSKGDLIAVTKAQLIEQAKASSYTIYLVVGSIIIALAIVVTVTTVFLRRRRQLVN